MRRRRAQGGQSLVLVAGLSMILVALAGLVLDGGEIASQYRLNQSAADAAALAAAYQITTGNTETAATNQADLVVKQHGIATTDLTLSFADGSGTPTTDPSSVATVTASIKHGFPTLFLPVLGIDAASVSTSATVGLYGVSCVVCVLDSGSSALSIGGNNTSLSLSGGVVEVASSYSAAISLGNNGNTLNGGDGVYVVGGVGAPAGTVTPAPTTVSSVSDPLSGLAAPTAPAAGSCTGNNSSQTCTPGTYGNFPPGSASFYTLNPGLYVVTGNFATSGSQSISAVGVTFYLTCGNVSSPNSCANTNGNGGGMTINGQAGSSVTITAPTTGTYANIAVFSDRSNVTGLSVGGQGTVAITGTIYAKSAALSFGGGATGSTFNARVVTKDLSLSGGSSFSLQYPTTGNLVVPSKLALSS